MKDTFGKLVTALAIVAAASARAELIGQHPMLNLPPSTVFQLGQPFSGLPAALTIDTTAFLTSPATEEWPAPGGVLSLGDFGSYSLGSVVSPVRALEDFSSGPKISVPLPEPSSETSFYVLAGLVGLAFVVLRRRKLA